MKALEFSNDELNPIFIYAAKGQNYEMASAWDEAVFWYQRSLACLPKLFGADKMIRHPLSDHMLPATFTPEYAARIYAALARCLMALDRRDDGLLATEAAISLDPQNTARWRSMPTRWAAGDPSMNPVTIPSTIGKNQSRYYDNADLGSALTLLMVTHYTGPLDKFKSLSPPSCKLLTAAYGSLLDVFGAEIRECPKILGYDFNAKGGQRENSYAHSLEQFSRLHGFDLTVYPSIGLFNILKRSVATVTTPYILFVEHDWLFQGGPIRIAALIRMMNQTPHIHTVRFNKRKNRIDGNDFLLNVNGSHDPYPLLRTSSYSNNPSLIRTDKLRNDWLPICDKALQRVSKKLGGSAFGVEEILFKRLAEDIRVQGFESAHADWGTYLFGGAGDPPRIVHLGE